MSDFIYNVKISEDLVSNVASNLSNAMAVSNNKTPDVSYDVVNNKYNFSYGENTTVSLYSTDDILNYYFGDNRNKVMSEGKIYTIVQPDGFEAISYEGVIIGIGVNNKTAEKAFNKGLTDYLNSVDKEELAELVKHDDFKASDLVDYLENDIAASAGVGIGGAAASGSESHPVAGNLMANAIAYGFFGYHMANTHNGNSVDSSEYVKAISALNGLDMFNLSYPGAITFSAYGTYFTKQAQKNFLLQLLPSEFLGGYKVGTTFEYNTMGGDKSYQKWLENFNGKKSYEDWCRDFTGDERSRAKWRDENCVGEVPFYEWLESYKADKSNYEYWLQHCGDDLLNLRIDESGTELIIKYDENKYAAMEEEWIERWNLIFAYKQENSLASSLSDKTVWEIIKATNYTISQSDTADSGAGLYEDNAPIEDEVYPRLKNVKSEFDRAKTSQRSTGYNVIDPLIIDLGKDGFDIEQLENGTHFDLDSNGFAERMNWTRKDGFLALDLNGNGVIDNGGELFGDRTLLAS